MARVRGHWFIALREGLDELGLRGVVERSVSPAARAALASPDPVAWHDEAHAVAIYETVVACRDLDGVRGLARLAARRAMQTAWRPLMAPIVRLCADRPGVAFGQLPLLWDAIRREGGEVRCVSTEPRAAITEVRGCAYVGNAAWREWWLGVHEALLRELRVGGRCTVEHLDERTKTLRVRATWSFALAGAPTSGSLAHT